MCSDNHVHLSTGMLKSCVKFHSTLVSKIVTILTKAAIKSHIQVKHSKCNCCVSWNHNGFITTFGVAPIIYLKLKNILIDIVCEGF